MKQLTTDDLIELVADHEPPCISMYQPTHRHYPGNQQDPIRYCNLLREIEASLRQRYLARDVQPLLEGFQALARDDHFWNHQLDGLAIFCSTEMFRVFELQRPVRELLVVADSFHVKPLIRLLQSADRYQVLCLNRHEVRLYEGNRYVLDPVELTNVPSTITEALGGELTEPHLTVASYGGAGGPHSSHGQVAMHHGHGTKRDEVEIDTERFFRVIDRAILEHYSRRSGLPLILAGLAEYHAPFHQISHNPHLMVDGIRMNPQALSADQLRAEAWRIAEPFYLQRLARLVEDYESARSRKLGSDDLSRVAQAAVAGRVGTLLVEADRQIAGNIDRATGRIQPGDLADPHVDDLLDDLAEMVLRAKGKVVALPAERMPSRTGGAATYRF
jgi:hypothetical protein